MIYIKIQCTFCGSQNYYEVPVMDYKKGQAFECKCGAHMFELVDYSEEENKEELNE